MTTDRYIPREFTGLWQGLCLDLLQNPAPMDPQGPDRSDLFFVLPKLVLGRPQQAENRKARLEQLNRQFQLASQGQWDKLMQQALARPDSVREADNLNSLATSKMDSPSTPPDAFTELRPRDISGKPGDSSELPHHFT